MLKSRILSINEQNLLDGMERVEATGKEISELQCNLLTAYLWLEKYKGELKYDPDYNSVDKDKGIIGRYNGIPIVINEALDDGTVAIK